MLLGQSTADEIIHHALAQGASFCDIFVEENNKCLIDYRHQKAESIQSGIDFGIGVRLLYGDEVLYGYTNSTQKEDLLAIVNTLAKKHAQADDKSFTKTKLQPPSVSHATSQGLDQFASHGPKIEFLGQIDRAARAESDKIVQILASLIQRHQYVEIYNSDGLASSDHRHYIRFGVTAIAKDGNTQENGYLAPGAMKGWEFSGEIDPCKLGHDIAAQALIKLDAKQCPAGVMPVVLEKGFGGVIFHESCGHPLETTSVEKKASVFWDQMGERIAHEKVSAIDDGTIPNCWGSIAIDDEGMATQKTQLIKNGKLTNFLSDRVGEIKTGHARTGSARRESYKFPPASRMRNTYIEAGEDSFDDMISSIDEGLYAKAMGGGSVNPGTGEFNFAVQEGYIIKNGKIGEAVKGATLIGKGHEILKEISMVGTSCDLAAGMCGSVSGSVPVTVGQPQLKVDTILVGGSA